MKKQIVISQTDYEIILKALIRGFVDKDNPEACCRAAYNMLTDDEDEYED